MKKHTHLLTLLITFLFLVSCGGGGTQSSEESFEIGVTDSTITLGSWGPLTGPAALWGSVPRGTDAYFQYINEQGGINGRKINFVFKDDGYQPPKTVAAVREMVEQDEVFAFVGGVGTATCMAVKDYIVENNVPWFAPASGATYWAYPPVETIFSAFSLYFDEANILVNHAVNELGATKIAMIYQNDDFGKSALVGAQMTLEKHGLELVEAVSTEITDSDLNSHAARLKESGAEVVILQVLPRQAAIITGTTAVMDYNPQWMANSVLSDMGLMHQITEGRWENVIFSTFINALDLSGDKVDTYKDALARYYPDLRWGGFSAIGFFYGEAVSEALKNAGEDLTREKFIAALEAFDGFQGIGSPITFGEGNRQGLRGAGIYRCQSDSEYEVLTAYAQAEINIEDAMAQLGGM